MSTRLIRSNQVATIVKVSVILFVENMKAIFVLVGLLPVCLLASDTPQCSVNPVTIPKEWITMHDQCRKAMRAQIQMEVKASLQYLAMGAHFSRDLVNRPGFAKLFFEAASEEREHAMKLIDYLLMRGELTYDVSSLIQTKAPELIHWKSGVEALEHALRMESEVTESIRRVIIECENERSFNDYHLVDYLTGEFLEEQYKGQRDLAGKATTLKKMFDRHGALGEFIFDKKLLGIDV